ncbi:Fur family transcriptional regulator [Clostridium sp.]|uniref:Fur family transcriptional regulator n=1 Tax=Clostridium sp. TaxID=1506 RepID=UPI0025C13638|nr:Fur family transcriptional regulator [Clostridium sp.]
MPIYIHRMIGLDSQSLNLDYLKLNKKMEKEKDLEIYDSNIIFVGLCSKCRKEIKCRR